jgi:hypothetical protein
MASKQVSSSPWLRWLPANPNQLVAAGVVTSALAVAMHLVPGSAATCLRIALLLTGLLLSGGAVWWQLRFLGPSFEERARSSILLAVAGASVLGGYLAMDEAWNSLRMVLIVLWVVVLAAVLLVLLPSIGRRIVVSLLLLIHFGGILTATTAVQTINGSVPWLPSYLWNKVYRHYLTFAYLNNAYHFYSPEPGPPTLVWFRVEFEDKDVPAEWLRLANRDECATRLQYQRLLALTESTNQHTPVSTAKLSVLMTRLHEGIGKFNRDAAQRNPPGERLDFPQEYFFDPASHYREPLPVTKRYLASYVRHVARTIRSRDHPDAKVKRIKVYRLIHGIIYAQQLKEGVISPLDPMMYAAYFQGEYDPEGQLVYTPFGPKDAKTIVWAEPDVNGVMRDVKEPARDPFLYWQLPIIRKPIDPRRTPQSIEDTQLIDMLSIHAGGSAWRPENEK